MEFHRQGFGVWDMEQHITQGFINANLDEHHTTGVSVSIVPFDMFFKIFDARREIFDARREIFDERKNEIS